MVSSSSSEDANARDVRTSSLSQLTQEDLEGGAHNTGKNGQCLDDVGEKESRPAKALPELQTDAWLAVTGQLRFW